jgi:HAD superfamily hydrolase (TIGR01509 family)
VALMGAQPKSLVFDLDGTLVDSMGAFLGVYVNAIRVLGGPDLQPSDVVAAFHVGPTRAVLAHFLGRPATEADLDCFYELAAAAAPTVRTFEGVPQMLAGLAARRVPVGLFTGATRRATDLLLTSCGLAKHFYAVVAGDEVTRPKPCEDGLLAICDQLHLPPSRVAYVGDTQDDVDCARNAGCVAITTSWGGRSALVIGADIAVAAPAELLELAAPAARPGRSGGMR